MLLNLSRLRTPFSWVLKQLLDFSFFLHMIAASCTASLCSWFMNCSSFDMNYVHTKRIKIGIDDRWYRLRCDPVCDVRVGSMLYYSLMTSLFLFCVDYLVCYRVIFKNVELRITVTAAPVLKERREVETKTLRWFFRAWSRRVLPCSTRGCWWLWSWPWHSRCWWPATAVLKLGLERWALGANLLLTWASFVTPTISLIRPLWPHLLTRCTSSRLTRSRTGTTIARSWTSLPFLSGLEPFAFGVIPMFQVLTLPRSTTVSTVVGMSTTVACSCNSQITPSSWYGNGQPEHPQEYSDRACTTKTVLFARW